MLDGDKYKGKIRNRDKTFQGTIILVKVIKEGRSP